MSASSAVDQCQRGTREKMTLILAAPRGFCAGVDRAIQIVELALAKYGPPVYVRHEIVHNRFVVDSLRAKGAIFVEELDEIPIPMPCDLLGTWGAVSVPAAASNLFYLDATSAYLKVHKEVHNYYAQGYDLVSSAMPGTLRSSAPWGIA